MADVFMKPVTVSGINSLPIADGQFILDKETGYLYIDWQGVRYPAGYKGEKGDPGAAGQNGQDGADGKDGVGVTSVTKTSTSGLVDTYTITLSNGSTSTFTVTNGRDGANGQDGADGRTYRFSYADGLLTIN